MPVRPAPVLLVLFGLVVFFNILKTPRMFDCISERPINIPGFLAGIIVAFPMLGATTGAFPMPGAFIVGVPIVGAFIVAFALGTFGAIGIPIVAFGTTGLPIVAFCFAGIPIVVFGIMVISFGKGLISGMPLSPVVDIIVGLIVAAIVIIPTAATNDARTSSTIATFNILISIPPQYPLCRTTHQLSYTVINIIII
jgi:hypothetical protein